MSYKNSSEFGSRVSTHGSDTPARKIKSNADIFAEHGNPWDGPDPATRPRSPDGQLRMSTGAHLYNLTHKAEAKGEADPHGEQATDISFSTEFVRPIAIRLAKENNTLLKSMTTGSKPVSPRGGVALRAAAALRSKRASHLVKVK